MGAVTVVRIARPDLMARHRALRCDVEPRQVGVVLEARREETPTSSASNNNHGRDKPMTEAAADRELVITRVFDAPRELVYKAFVDPDQVAQWFGPVGFSVPRETVDIDARVGGHQRFVMVSDSDPDMKSPVNATFTEVVENELLAGSEEWEGVPGRQGGGRMTFRIEFHDDGGKTRLVLRQGPYTADAHDMAGQGWESSFTKLDALLAG